MVSYDRNPYFTGRDELLDDLQQMLLETQLKKYNHRVAIYGMGGVGKTQIAIEYAYRYKKDYNDIYWIRAVDQAALLSGFQELARIARCLPSGADNSKPQEVATTVLYWLRSQKNWLVVIDNLDDISIAAEFLPAIDSGGHTLITTRNQHSSTIPAEGLEVSVLKEGDAVGLLLSRAGIDEAEFSSHRNTAMEIVKELGYLPLAIDFAAAFIKSLKSIDQFLPLYQNSRKRILAIKSPNELLYPHAVSTTFLLSFEKVKTMDYGDEAAKLLRLFAFLNPDGILIDFLRSGSNGLSDQLREILQDDFAFYQALALLRQFSLIGRPKRDIIAIHRLIQAILKDQLSEAETKTYLGEVVELSFEVFPTGWDTKELRELCRTLQDQVVEPIFEAAKFESHRGGILLMRIGLFLHHDGKLKDAERLERRSWNILKRTLGVEHPDTLTSMHNLASTYFRQGKFQEAVDLEEKVLEATRRTLGVEHRDTLTSMNNLALTYCNQGKFQEAVDLQEKVLEARRRTLGVEHPDTLTSMNNVSITYATFGRATDAILLMVPCVEASRRVLGQRHPDTIAREHTLEIFENEKLGHPSP